jgi:hypothetical protein
LHLINDLPGPIRGRGFLPPAREADSQLLEGEALAGELGWALGGGRLWTGLGLGPGVEHGLVGTQGAGSYPVEGLLREVASEQQAAAGAFFHGDKQYSMEMDLDLGESLEHCQPWTERCPENPEVCESKPCKCSKIGCLKLYCECFMNGRRCTGRCACRDCRNRCGHSHEIREAKKQVN